MFDTASSHRERDHDYGAVVAQLSPDWRVIECRDRIQWILQRKRAGRRRSGEWKGVGYFTTREALIRVSAASVSRSAAEMLHGLPPNYPRKRE